MSDTQKQLDRVVAYLREVALDRLENAHLMVGGTNNEGYKAAKRFLDDTTQKEPR